MIPVLGREVAGEGQQGVAVLREALDCPGILRPIFLGEGLYRGFGRRPGLRTVDLARDTTFIVAWTARGTLFSTLAVLLQPTTLMSSAGIDLVERLPEAERAVTDRDLGRNGQPAPLHLDQELTPALNALPDADLEADQLLPALGRRAIITSMMACSSMRACR